MLSTIVHDGDQELEVLKAEQAAYIAARMPPPADVCKLAHLQKVKGKWYSDELDDARYDTLWRIACLINDRMLSTYTNTLYF